ncbi:antitoxin [Escherichia coli]|nr:antitoxin [Escherichia coli]EIX7349275.1 antitoxin [Escherichia coli]
MSTALSPLVSEFETVEQENSYNKWLQAKVAASLSDPRPAIPHDEVMAEMEQLIAQIAATNRGE